MRILEPFTIYQKISETSLKYIFIMEEFGCLNKDEQFKNAFGFSLEAVMGRLDSYKQSNEKTSKIKNKASYAFADYGLQICFQPSGITETEMYKIRKKLSFEILDEEQPLIEVKKENVDIPILENAEFDGNNMDEDSFI